MQKKKKHTAFIAAALWGDRVPCYSLAIIIQQPVLMIILRRINKIYGSDLPPTLV